MSMTSVREKLESLERLNESPRMRLAITFAVALVLVSSYLLINNSLEHKVDLLLPIDEWIPYWPWTVVIYIGLYPMYFIAALSLSARQYVKILFGVITMTCVSFICFALMTSHYPRPSPEAWADSVWRPLIDLIVTYDRPGNTCPSLHVSTSLYVGWMLKSGRWGKTWLMCSLLISLSTLTLKQHFVWDWIGGSLLAALMVYTQQVLWTRVLSNTLDALEGESS